MGASLQDNGELTVEAGKRLSWIWVVPLFVVAVAAWTVYRSYVESGVMVEIRFAQGKGIEAGKTEIRYKDVVVGTVDSLSLTDDLNGVIATARLDREVEPYLGETTGFWIVTAAISGTSLRGLSTLLSGAYIEVDWSEIASDPRREFEGRLEPPLTPPSVGGRHFVLNGLDAGSVAVGSPVIYRGLQVGQVERRGLSEDYQRIEFEVFIEAPFDSLIATSTRFYDVSGLAVSVTAEGVALQIGSLQTLAAGGVSFYTPTGEVVAPPAAPGQRFTLFSNRGAAEESFFEADDAPHFYFSAVFESTLEGLEPGAPVIWQGIRLGTVEDIKLDIGERPGDNTLTVILDLQPARIGLDVVGEEQARDDLSSWVDSGMRLEIATSNLLTGKKYLNVVERPDSEPARMQREAMPYPQLPTVASSMGAVTQNLGDIAESLAGVSYEELATSATSLLVNAATLLGSEQAQALPKTLSQSLASIDMLAQQLGGVASEGEATLSGLSPDSALYIELSQTVRELRDAARSVSALATLLEENPNALLTGRK
ncbi:MAG: intermembrane transport protein PqiB [Congregibacter sp.]